MKATEQKVENPYVGPRPFEEQEQRRFFGRDWEADELVSLVIAHPAVLLYAQSGAGKTSLINAKLIPLLRDEESLEVMPVARVRGEIPAEVQPEQIENLFVFNTLLGWMDEAAPTQLARLSLSAFLEGWPRPKDEEGQPTLRMVIFDQFEELFTLYPERWAEREGFFAQVADALSEDPFLRVLFVLREDYLAQLDPYVDLLPERLRIRFRLERLRQEAALAAVKGPLMDTERSFAPGVAESLVEELLKIRVETRVGETVEVSGEFVEPVQLQVVCRSLWEEMPPDVTEITQPHLQAFGDVDQALRTFYERALSNALQQAKVREGKFRDWFERDLITPMGTRGTVYRGARSTGGVPNAAIDALESQHLIRAERRAGARWYELTHDRFIGPIQKSNEAWHTARQERWIRIAGGGVSLVLAFLFVGTTVLQAIRSGQKVAQAEATVTVAARGTGTAVARVEATATAAFDSENQATADFRAWQTAQVQATAASGNLQTVQAQATATSTGVMEATPQPGETKTPSLDPTAIAVLETATAAAQSLQIAEQKAVAAASELKATATAAASATAAARELREQLQTAGLTGRGVKVAILSTGIDAAHPDLEGRIAATENWIREEGIEDGNGFGTFLASIVAGNGAASGGLYKGLAPGADLYIAKVMNAEGASALSDVIAGIEWAMEQEVDIVLVPLAGGAPDCDGSDEISQKANAAVEAGRVVVVPAGNSGPEPKTLNVPGCAHLPITVGAAELNTVANFSSRGPTFDNRAKPDVLFSSSGVGAQATGTEIGTVVPPRYVKATGSGVSAAHAAGAIALLLQADPDLTPAQVKDLLMETATDLGVEPEAQGAGLANIERALAYVIDRDGDGILDYADACPDEPGLLEHDGCPDSDGDGIPNAEDACPDEPGSPPEGCPEPTPTITPTLTPTATPTSTPSPTRTPTVSIPITRTVEITSGVEVQMVYVPAGEFIMGSGEEVKDSDEDERPVHTVYLDAFYIDRTEVTNEQFEQFVQTTGYMTGTGSIWNEDSGKFELDSEVDWRHPQGPDDDLSGKADHPVVHVSWEDAAAYCRWRGARLPTEAEWEKVAGWDDERKRKQIWPWGNDMTTPTGNRPLNYCDARCQGDWRDDEFDDGFGATAPVGSYPEGTSPYGVLDMSGNVWEWVADYYDERYYEVSPAKNPLGPDADTGEQVLRGGSWFEGYGKEGRAASRFSIAPDTRRFDIGFRCAQNP